MWNEIKTLEYLKGFTCKIDSLHHFFAKRYMYILRLIQFQRLCRGHNLYG